MSSAQNNTFHVADYIVFAAFLIVSAGIGIYLILLFQLVAFQISVRRVISIMVYFRSFCVLGERMIT